MELCCESQDMKIIEGMFTCISCGTIHGSELVHDFVQFKPYNIVPKKTIYNRDYHIKSKLIFDSCAEIQQFKRAWKCVEKQLNRYMAAHQRKRSPKLDFFINKTLEAIDVPKQRSPKLSEKTKQQYEKIWEKIYPNFFLYNF